MKYLFLSIILFIISIILLFLYKKTTQIKEKNNIQEGFTNDEFVNQQEKYYESRDQTSLFDGMEQADKFLEYEPYKKEGTQLVEFSPDVPSTTETNIDDNVQQCRNISSCDELDNTPCGYCFYDKKFYYGNENGPLTDVCPSGWVKTKEECLKRRERTICDRVTNCHNMVGEASICAWCPTKKKAFVYKIENGKYVPKYPDDKCENQDVITGEDLELVPQEKCGQFEKDHPCIGPNEDTGPHSLQCLEHLWKEAGGTPQGTHAPQNNSTQREWWNQRGWRQVFQDMKAWVRDANSSDWNLVKSHYEGVYGKKPDPCSSQFKGNTPLPCFQKLFTKQGCTEKGSGYPTTLADVSKIAPSKTKVEYENKIQDVVGMSHNQDITFNKRDENYNYCYGGHLKAPPTVKVGDYVKYIFDYPPWGKNTELYGYVCQIENGNANVFWEMILHKDGKTNSVTRKWHLNDRKSMNEWLGSYCGQVPEKLAGYVKNTIPIVDLHIVHSCKQGTECPNNGCGLQNIVYIHKPSKNYSISKNEIGEIVDKVKGVFTDSVIAQIEDIQYLVDSGLPYCACGWVLHNGKYTSVYPSVRGTNNGCGGGQEKIISCGDNGPSWANGMAGIYMRVRSDPTQFETLLSKQGLKGNIVATVGKNTYQPLTGVAVNTMKMESSVFKHPLIKANSQNVRKISDTHYSWSGNGKTYEIETSSVWMSGGRPGFPIYQGFDGILNNSNNVLHSAINIYNRQSGKYTGNKSFNGVKGYWVKLKLDKPYYINKVLLNTRYTIPARMARDFYVFGSNDNITWNNLLYKKDVTNWSRQTNTQIFPFQKPGIYQYLTLVVPRVVGNNGSAYCCNIGEIEYISDDLYTKHETGQIGNQYKGPFNDKYLRGWSSYGSRRFSSLQEAQNACNQVSNCSGITSNSSQSSFTLRKGNELIKSPSNEKSWIKSGGSGNSRTIYLGCFRDKKERALPNWIGVMTFEQGYQECIKRGYKYFGLQYGNNKGWKGLAQIWAGNDNDRYDKYGETNNCRRMEDGNISGGNWTNAVYMIV